jgi:hypothetical protein
MHVLVLLGLKTPNTANKKTYQTKAQMATSKLPLYKFRRSKTKHTLHSPNTLSIFCFDDDIADKSPYSNIICLESLNELVKSKSFECVFLKNCGFKA